ncbi:RICIN domain-containing protein [Streptomyces sp. NPDC001339]|uniref:RICIN domain-containing protein n=1 Tax=Streptomyces sp. NPDC001339 TaxID=3364563 RepID=UPI00368E8EC3
MRAMLATAASAAALFGTTTAAHADQVTPRAADAAPSVVKLQAAHSGQCLTIADGSFRNEANAVQSKCADGLDNQLFELVPTDSATFEIRAKHSGKCLEVADRDTKAGANVQQWWCVGDAPQQRWRLSTVDVIEDLYELRPAHALDRCLDISGGSDKDGANAQQWSCNGTTAQRWRLLPAAA